MKDLLKEINNHIEEKLTDENGNLIPDKNLDFPITNVIIKEIRKMETNSQYGKGNARYGNRGNGSGANTTGNDNGDNGGPKVPRDGKHPKSGDRVTDALATTTVLVVTADADGRFKMEVPKDASIKYTSSDGRVFTYVAVKSQSALYKVCYPPDGSIGKSCKPGRTNLCWAKKCDKCNFYGHLQILCKQSMDASGKKFET